MIKEILFANYTLKYNTLQPVATNSRHFETKVATILHAFARRLVRFFPDENANTAKVVAHRGERGVPCVYWRGFVCLGHGDRFHTIPPSLTLKKVLKASHHDVTTRNRKEFLLGFPKLGTI